MSPVRYQPPGRKGGRIERGVEMARFREFGTARTDFAIRARRDILAVIVDEPHFRTRDRTSLGVELLFERVPDDARGYRRMLARSVAMIDGETLALAALDQRGWHGSSANEILAQR